MGLNTLPEVLALKRAGHALDPLRGRSPNCAVCKFFQHFQCWAEAAGLLMAFTNRRCPTSSRRKVFSNAAASQAVCLSGEGSSRGSIWIGRSFAMVKKL